MQIRQKPTAGESHRGRTIYRTEEEALFDKRGKKQNRGGVGCGGAGCLRNWPGGGEPIKGLFAHLLLGPPFFLPARAQVEQ
jgi:hypothetical protein